MSKKSQVVLGWAVFIVAVPVAGHVLGWALGNALNLVASM